MPFGQFASTTQFYLYGKKYCTKTGWKAASDKYAQPDILSSSSTLSLEKKVFIVTGANSGVGFEVSSHLASRNATVYLVCRNPERAEKAKQDIFSASNNPNIHILICDCSLQSSVRSMWDSFVGHQQELGESPRLDGLLCNAGGLSNEPTFTEEGIETTFAAHLLFGTYLLVNLALTTLQSTPESRVVVVSSGGMYNTKFPTWDVAAGMSGGKFDGQFAYAYAKRGQVLLCERWSERHPGIKFVSCHPGWVDTAGVTAAYGEKKSYLEPMRNLWEGSEGIIWLLVAERDQLEGGAFYLDRKPRVKHMAGPFFTEGSFTKNSEREVDDMMRNLDLWTSPRSPKEGEGELARWQYVLNGDITYTKTRDMKPRGELGPLCAMERSVDIKRFMGRWYVQANIPTFLDRDTVNNIEDYIWDEGRNMILVSFKYSAPLLERDDAGGIIPGPQKEVKQHGTIVNEWSTEWSLAVKIVIYWSIPTKYLILGLDELEGEEDAYSSCMIGVPDRSCLWIMNRSTQPMSEEALQVYREKAGALGYDVSKIGRVPFINSADEWQDEDPKELSVSVDQMSKEERLDAIEGIYSTFSEEEKGECVKRLNSSETAN